MYSMKRRMWPVPRKWRAMSTMLALVHAALDDHVDLDRRAARRSRPRRWLRAPSHGDTRRRSSAGTRFVQGVQADGDRGAARRSRSRRAPCGRAASRWWSGSRSSQALDIAPASPTSSRQSRRSSGSPPVRRILLTPSPTKSRARRVDLLEGQQLGARQERVVPPEDLLGHAVGAAEVAAVGDRDAQVAQRASEAIGQCHGERMLPHDCSPTERLVYPADRPGRDDGPAQPRQPG